MKKIKVVISGLIYPLTMMHYFWRAFERRNDVDLAVAGVFFDDWIPWNGGMTLPKRYVKVPTVALPRGMANMRPNHIIVQGQLPEKFQKPDLWVQIDAGWHLGDRPDAKIVAHVQTDPHVLKGHYKLPKSYSDYNFCMQCGYMQDNEIYLPYAYDPELHYHMDIAKKYDGCMIGLQYENRVGLAKKLRSKGYNIYSNIGDVYDEYRILYNESRIDISWSSLNDTPARVFEAFGMKIPLLCNRTPDLANLGYKEYEHYFGFNGMDEAIDGFEYLVKNYDDALKMADKAYEIASEQDTWDDRVETILQKTGLI
jgi:hypothetical protein